jgi:molybdopterin/thiamine biosynthesis adenylyltransferase
MEDSKPLPRFSEVDVSLPWDRERMIEKKITCLIIGGGRIGSLCLGMCALCGLCRLILVDPDGVEQRNIQSLPGWYMPDDIRKFKVEATKKRIEAIYPDVEVIAYVRKIEDLPQRLITEPDVVIEASDDPRTKSYVNRIRVSTRRPDKVILQLGFWEHEVGFLLTLPTKTACWNCLPQDSRRRRSRHNQSAPYFIASIGMNELIKLILYQELGRPPIIHYYRADLLHLRERRVYLHSPLKPECRICKR